MILSVSEPIFDKKKNTWTIIYVVKDEYAGKYEQIVRTENKKAAIRVRKMVEEFICKEKQNENSSY